MASEKQNLSERDKLRQQRNREIDFFQNLRLKLLQAKNELNNDLNRLAVKNLPIMDSNFEEQIDESKQTTSDQIIVQSIDEPTEQVEIQQLEPLDLDL